MSKMKSPRLIHSIFLTNVPEGAKTHEYQLGNDAAVPSAKQRKTVQGFIHNQSQIIMASIISQCLSHNSCNCQPHFAQDSGGKLLETHLVSAKKAGQGMAGVDRTVLS